MFPLRRTRFDVWTLIRSRMMRETERFLEEGLRHPERQLIIPAIRVGCGCFPRGFAHAFWAQVLGAS